VNIDTKLAQDVFKLDKEPHIVVDQAICAATCTSRPCLFACPADLYEANEQGQIIVNWEGCLECGTCMICCDRGALSWSYPRGGFGVQYRSS
jgi:ferredoxin like protein